MLKDYIINIILKIGIVLSVLFSIIYVLSFIYIIAYSVFYGKLNYLGEICLKIVGYTTMIGVCVLLLILLWEVVSNLTDIIKK